jgi:cytochrome c-type biogenesis protein CcmH/NrfG
VLTVIALARPRLSRAAGLFVFAALLVAALAGLLPGPANPRYVDDKKRFASGVEVAQASFDPRSTAVRTRLGLWRRSLAMWREHPIWGVGPGQWPILFPRYAEPGAAQSGVLTPTLAPRQVHNDAIERLTETGAVGLFALLFLGGAVVITVRGRLRAGAGAERAATAAGAGALVALVATGLTGFPLEMPGTLALGGVALGLVAPGAGSRPRVFEAGLAVRWRRHLAQAAVAILAGTLVLAVALRAERQLRGSYWLGEAERALGHSRAPNADLAAIHALEKAAAATPAAFPVWLRSAHAALRLGRAAEAVAASQRALLLEPFSPNAWATLASAQLAAGDVPGARASAARALALLHDYPFALFIEARAAEATGDGAAATAGWDRLAAVARSQEMDKETVADARALLEARRKATK